MAAGPHEFHHAQSLMRCSTGGRISANFKRYFWFGIFVNFLDSTCPQDVGLPYMTDERHASDTLFLVAENNFRIMKEHCVSGRNWLLEVDEFVEKHLRRPDIVDAWGREGPAYAPEDKPVTPTTQDETGVAIAQVEPVAHPEVKQEVKEEVKEEPDSPPPCTGEQREKGKGMMESISFWSFSQGQKYLGREPYISEELNDLVRIATVAQRKGKGDLIWYSWEGSSKSKTMPSHGSSLVGVSKEGAFKLLDAIQKTRNADRFDIWLRQLCCEQRQGLQASYVLPSIGSYDKHISGCDPVVPGVEDIWRPSNWNDYWCAEGIRLEGRVSKHKQRNVCDFCQSVESRDWGIRVDFNEANVHLVWKTERPPKPYWEGGLVWENILNQRGWLDRHGWLQLPNHLLKPRQHDEWRLLQMEPDAEPWDDETGTYSPITRLAEHVVVWQPEEVTKLVHLERRTSRAMQDHLRRYKQRHFTKECEACCRQL